MAAPLPASIQDDQSIRRARYTTIDFGTLPQPAAGGAAVTAQNVTLDLFPDVTLVAEFDRFHPSSSSVTWVGHVAGDPFSSVTLSYGGDALAASVRLTNRYFEIRPAPAGAPQSPQGAAAPLHLVVEIDTNGLPAGAPPVVLTSADLGEAAASPLEPADSGETVDLLVVYTPAAVAFAGGEQGVRNRIDVAVAETNTAFMVSGVHTSIRLVHAELVPYTETNVFSTNLNDLRTGAGALGGVPGLREQHRADLVKLIVRSPPNPDACGIGYLQSVPPNAFTSALGFTVTDVTCASSVLAFPHEIGHNMGLHHDWFVSTGRMPFTFAHGYVDPTLGQRWRTIMSYADLCNSLGFSCPLILRWSNPTQRFNPACSGRGFSCLSQFWYVPGVPMGVPGGTRSDCVLGDPSSWLCDSDETRALNETAAFIANYRSAVPPNIRSTMPMGFQRRR